MRSAIVLVFALALVSSVASGQSQQSTAQPDSRPANQPISTKIIPGSRVFIEPMNGFENYLMAAFGKKKVQLVAVADKDQADYVITGTSDEKKAGWAKVISGQVHSDNAASVTMVDKKSGAVLFAYAVDKKNTLHCQQTTDEACAKHLQEKIEGKD